MSDVEKGSRRLQAKFAPEDVPPELAEAMMQELNKSIMIELLAEEKADLSSDEMERLWKACKGNPWDAPILYRMLKMLGKF